MALAGLHHFDELEAQLVAPADVAPPRESSNFAYRYAVPSALLASQRRQPEQVAALAAASRREITAHGPALDQPLVLCDLAGAALEVGLPKLAQDLAREAKAMACTHQFSWWQARASLLGSVACGPGPEGDRLLAEALALTEGFGLEALWSARERARAGPLLARALVAGLGASGQAARLAVTCGGEVLSAVGRILAAAPPVARSALAEASGESTHVDHSLVQTLLADTDEAVRRAARRAQNRLVTTPRPPVRIVSLGGFSVWRGGLAVAELTTGRQKARTVLAILLSAEGAVHREVLLEYLWPNLPPDRGLAALHSALYTLRRALEPGASRQSPPTLVMTDGETYRLNLAEQDQWDAATFYCLAQEAAEPRSLEARLQRLLAAEATWGGCYLLEWPYEDWADGRRTELNRTHEGVLEALAEALAEADQHRAALTRWQQLVESDPERESWQRSLMIAYVRAGERILALRQYQACRKLLRERLGVEPSSETTTLYTTLL